jgi:REP element-mobilizing transposase RayT
MQRIEDWLDQGMGECLLRDPPVRDIVADNLHHFDGARYDLGCFVEMPNHVHAVVRPLNPTDCALEKILQTAKGYTALKINRLLSGPGNRWQEESFDRIIRDEEHLYRVIQYVGRNPARAGLDPNACRRWIRPSWAELGWRFEEPPQSP